MYKCSIGYNIDIKYLRHMVIIKIKFRSISCSRKITDEIYIVILNLLHKFNIFYECIKCYILNNVYTVNIYINNINIDKMIKDLLYVKIKLYIFNVFKMHSMKITDICGVCLRKIKGYNTVKYYTCKHEIHVSCYDNLLEKCIYCKD